MDAKWTPLGSIVYTTNASTVGKVSEASDVLIRPIIYQMKAPRYLTVDFNTIYLTDLETGVFQSTDDGVSWNMVFKATDGWDCVQVIRVTSNLTDDFWTVARTKTQKIQKYGLHIYSVDRIHTRTRPPNVTRKDVKAFSRIGKMINLSKLSRLSYDDQMKNIFLTNCPDQIVHIFSLNSQYRPRLLPLSRPNKCMWRLEVDRKTQLLYAGQGAGKIGVFKLT